MKEQEQMVCKLIKSLYEIKKAPYVWYINLTKHLLKLNFQQFNLDDATLFVKKIKINVVYLMVYVDDISMIGNNKIYIS